MTIQYGFARGKMLVRMKARRYTVTTRAAPCLPRPSCPRITCSRRHHLRRSPPSSSCNSLQERSPSLSIKPLCPTALQQYSSSCCFQPPSFCRERACGLPCFAAEKRIVKSRQHLTSPSLRRSANRRSSCHSLCRATSDPTVQAQPHFHFSVLIYVLAAAVELAAEPLYIRAQNELRVDVRVRAEDVAVLLKTLATFLGLAFASPEWALFAFAAGQAAYSIATFTVFWNFCGRSTQYLLSGVTLEDHGQ
jgi:hypothetical protein